MRAAYTSISLEARWTWEPYKAGKDINNRINSTNNSSMVVVDILDKDRVSASNHISSNSMVDMEANNSNIINSSTNKTIRTTRSRSWRRSSCPGYSGSCGKSFAVDEMVKKVLRMFCDTQHCIQRLEIMG